MMICKNVMKHLSQPNNASPIIRKHLNADALLKFPLKMHWCPDLPCSLLKIPPFQHLMKEEVWIWTWTLFMELVTSLVIHRCELFLMKLILKNSELRSKDLFDNYREVECLNIWCSLRGVTYRVRMEPVFFHQKDFTLIFVWKKSIKRQGKLPVISRCQEHPLFIPISRK